MKVVTWEIRYASAPRLRDDWIAPLQPLVADALAGRCVTPRAALRDYERRMSSLSKIAGWPVLRAGRFYAERLVLEFRSDGIWCRRADRVALRVRRAR